MPRLLLLALLAVGAVVAGQVTEEARKGSQLQPVVAGPSRWEPAPSAPGGGSAAVQAPSQTPCGHPALQRTSCVRRAHVLHCSRERVLLVSLANGKLVALDKDTGRRLWTFDSGVPLLSSGVGM